MSDIWSWCVQFMDIRSIIYGTLTGKVKARQGTTTTTGTIGTTGTNGIAGEKRRAFSSAESFITCSVLQGINMEESTDARIGVRIGVRIGRRKDSSPDQEIRDRPVQAHPSPQPIPLQKCHSRMMTGSGRSRPYLQFPECPPLLLACRAINLTACQQGTYLLALDGDHANNP